MVWPDRVLFYADCSVNIAPDAATLAEIGRATAATARSFGIEPRVAFLSFSTRGSAEHADVERVRQAAALCRAAEPDLRLDGEMQFDAAFVPAVAAKKCPDSPLGGRGQRLRLPGPRRRQHRLQDHGAPGRRLRDRADPPGAAPRRERRLARVLASRTWPTSA